MYPIHVPIRTSLLARLGLGFACALAWAAGFAATLAAELDGPRAAAWSRLQPYAGSNIANPAARTLAGKVMCGYQGWFACEGDGSGQSWRHYSQKKLFQPGSCSIDLWPDVSELADDEKYATAFRLPNGDVAQVFSSLNGKTVRRHFEWMRRYGIDGAFVQRFAVELLHPGGLTHCNTVLAHCREAANAQGRSYAVMYDLSSLRAGGVQHVMDDWKLLVDRARLGRDDHDAAYLQHRGKPVVAVWGIGFNDGRRYTLDECARLIAFLKNDAKYGGNTVMVGVPSGWQTLDQDSVPDAALHDLVKAADIVSPWTVGRFASPKAVEKHAQTGWQPNLRLCQSRGQDYLPVVFPGFSWHNLRSRAPVNEIPRLQGQFLWKQFTELKRAGANMVYVAMFDELDEGTAIFKCTNNVPVGESPFVTFEGLPSDYYLWLTGMGAKLLRNEIDFTDTIPAREEHEK